MTESRCVKTSVFTEEASLLGFSEGRHIATINRIVVSENPGGRLEEGDWEFLFFASAHSAYICLRHRKLISSYPDIFLFLLLPVLFSDSSSSSSLKLSEGGWGGPVAITSRSFDALNIKPPFLLCQVLSRLGAMLLVSLPYVSKSFTLSSVILVELFWAFTSLLF